MLDDVCIYVYMCVCIYIYIWFWYILISNWWLKHVTSISHSDNTLGYNNNDPTMMRTRDDITFAEAPGDLEWTWLQPRSVPPNHESDFLGPRTGPIGSPLPHVWPKRFGAPRTCSCPPLHSHRRWGYESAAPRFRRDVQCSKEWITIFGLASGVIQV